MAPSGPALRAAVYALAVLLLLAPAPGFRGLDFLFPPNPARAVAFACAVARGAALALLILTPNLHALPPGLRRAAIMAGATPWQAAFHAVLAPPRMAARRGHVRRRRRRPGGRAGIDRTGAAPGPGARLGSAGDAAAGRRQHHRVVRTAAAPARLTAGRT
ncbi:MAG: hypothetical protein WDN04_15890 [Rhodospirillales bacterium]